MALFSASGGSICGTSGAAYLSTPPRNPQISLTLQELGTRPEGVGPSPGTRRSKLLIYELETPASVIRSFPMETKYGTSHTIVESLKERNIGLWKGITSQSHLVLLGKGERICRFSGGNLALRCINILGIYQTSVEPSPSPRDNCCATGIITCSGFNQAQLICGSKS